MGSLGLSRCNITERTPQNEPKYISMDISFEGTLSGELIDHQYIPSTSAELAVHFKGGVRSVDAVPLPVLAMLEENLEAICTEQVYSFYFQLF